MWLEWQQAQQLVVENLTRSLLEKSFQSMKRNIASSVFVQTVLLLLLYCYCSASLLLLLCYYSDICPIVPKFQLGSSLSHVEVQTIISRKVSVLLFLLICCCFYFLLMAAVSCYGCCCLLLLRLLLRKKSTRGKNARKWLKYDHTSGSQSFVARAFKSLVVTGTKQ